MLSSSFPGASSESKQKLPSFCQYCFSTAIFLGDGSEKNPKLVWDQQGFRSDSPSYETNTAVAKLTNLDHG